MFLIGLATKSSALLNVVLLTIKMLGQNQNSPYLSFTGVCAAVSLSCIWNQLFWLFSCKVTIHLVGVAALLTNRTACDITATCSRWHHIEPGVGVCAWAFGSHVHTLDSSFKLWLCLIWVSEQEIWQKIWKGRIGGLEVITSSGPQLFISNYYLKII